MKLNLKIVLSFTCMLLITEIIIAEPKQLICINDRTAAEEEARLRKLGEISMAEVCKSSDFAQKVVFAFDTDGLKNQAESNAEYTLIYACGVTDDTLSVKMTHTPSVISFNWMEYQPTTFNIDRKTLRSGFDTRRAWGCTLEDIDTSKNIL